MKNVPCEDSKNAKVDDLALGPKPDDKVFDLCLNIIPSLSPLSTLSLQPKMQTETEIFSRFFAKISLA